jgi:hypothetical protein
MERPEVPIFRGVKKPLSVLLALAALYLGGGLVIRLCSSDETKIRWLVEEMEEGYNTGSPGTTVGPLARTWHHDGSEIDRQMLLGALFEAARDRDRETKRLRSRVEVDEDAAVITVTGERATLAADAVFSRWVADAWKETWRVHFEAELVNGDGGWEIVQSRHQDQTGTHLGR